MGSLCLRPRLIEGHKVELAKDELQDLYYLCKIKIQVAFYKLQILNKYYKDLFLVPRTWRIILNNITSIVFKLVRCRIEWCAHVGVLL